tara:strand:+ start:3199 stop:3369 length:171 start_codon:yes stop_codon:yes gene_type:complete
MMATTMKTSELIKLAKEQLEREGDQEVVLRSSEFEYEPLSHYETVEHEGEDCFFLD